MLKLATTGILLRSRGVKMVMGFIQTDIVQREEERMEHSGLLQMGTGGQGAPHLQSQNSLAAEMQSEVVSAVLEMGFNPDIVRIAIQQHLQEHGSGFTSTHELVVAVLEERMGQSGSSQMGNGGTLDYTQEAVRLSTYQNFPDSVPVSASRMARAGFYYSGTGDRVVCFSCGGSVEGWDFGDTAMGEHERLYPHCNFVNGRETRNQPLLSPPGLFPASVPQIATWPPGQGTQAAPLPVPQAGRDIDPREQYKSEQRRLDSYATWPAWSPIQPRELAKAGFFYTGSEDRVQCFCCQRILRNWEAGDQAMHEHRRHFSSCPFILNFNVGNIPIEDQDPNLPPSAQQSVPSTPPASQASGLYPTARLHQPRLQVQAYQASGPKHPQMADEQARLSSFHPWPSPTPMAAQHLARAGFFYSMVTDSVKCFYCDGGLRNWDPGDDPWTEHAKWFPQCEFLRQQRGDNYVQGIQARFANLQAQQQILQQHMRPPDEAGTGQPAQSPQTSQSSLAAEMQSGVVSGVLEMGFDPDIVQNTVLQHLREHGSGFTSAHELVVAVLDREEERMEHSGLLQMGDGARPAEVAGASGTEELQPGTSEPMEPTAAASGEGNNLEQLQKELDKMKDERMCKICMDAEANIVFIPCGHLAVCANCAASVHVCPICRSSVHGTFRTYMS